MLFALLAVAVFGLCGFIGILGAKIDNDFLKILHFTFWIGAGLISAIYVYQAPTHFSEYEKYLAIKEEYESLTDAINSTTNMNDNMITADLRNKVEEHNKIVNETDIEMSPFIYDMKYNKSEYLIDISDYQVMTADENSVQNTTESTTEEITTSIENVDSSNPAIVGKVVEIDGKYYELVPIT